MGVGAGWLILPMFLLDVSVRRLASWLALSIAVEIRVLAVLLFGLDMRYGWGVVGAIVLAELIGWTIRFPVHPPPLRVHHASRHRLEQNGAAQRGRARPAQGETGAGPRRARYGAGRAPGATVTGGRLGTNGRAMRRYESGRPPGSSRSAICGRRWGAPRPPTRRRTGAVRPAGPTKRRSRKSRPSSGFARRATAPSGTWKRTSRERRDAGMRHDRSGS